MASSIDGVVLSYSHTFYLYETKKILGGGGSNGDTEIDFLCWQVGDPVLEEIADPGLRVVGLRLTDRRFEENGVGGAWNTPPGIQGLRTTKDFQSDLILCYRSIEKSACSLMTLTTEEWVIMTRGSFFVFFFVCSGQRRKDVLFFVCMIHDLMTTSA